MLEKYAQEGEYVVVNASGDVSQVFGTGPTEYASALMWAVSQAIINRTRCAVGYIDQGAVEIMIDVSHPRLIA